MRPFEYILIHHSEILLKGRNRPFFERKLLENVRRSLDPSDYYYVKLFRGRLLLRLRPAADPQRVELALSRVFGIENFAFAWSCRAEVEAMKEVLDSVQEVLREAKSFKVEAKRADKTIPLTSLQVNRELGAHVVQKYGTKVSLKEPQLTVWVEMVEGKAFIYLRRIKGLGGLPTGVSGRVLVLLSGGIDSPVASWLMMKRGCEPLYLHLHPFSKNEEVLGSKVEGLVKLLTSYSSYPSATLYLAPFYPFQMAVLSLKDPSYELILFRRFMAKLGEAIAKREGIKALVTGDNLGQVASQTLEGLVAIDDAVALSIFRPLLGFTKQEIVALAEKIGSYSLSIKDYKDCCSILAPHPAIRPTLDRIRECEEKMEMERVVGEALALSERYEVKRDGLIEAHHARAST